MKIIGTLSQEEIEMIIAKHIVGERTDVNETEFEVTFHISGCEDYQYISANVEVEY